MDVRHMVALGRLPHVDTHIWLGPGVEEPEQNTSINDKIEFME